MGPLGTLGPIDPQINGVPARAILRAFENLEARLKNEGPRALTAYMPLISKYDLHILEICKSAQELSEELARTWLSTYMLKCPPEDEAVTTVVDFFKSYDALADLLQSLLNQYELWFDKTSFYKMFEDARGTNWGRQIQSMTIQLPLGGPPTAPQPPAQP